MENTKLSHFSIDVHNLRKGQMLIDVKEDRHYIVHECGIFSIKLIAVEGNRIRVIQVDDFKAGEWKAADE